MSSDRILDLFEQIDRTPVGPEERALIDEAISLAVEAGDEPLEYRARMRLTSSACMTGDTETMLTSFAWCLGKHDGDRGRFPADLGDETADLMWQFKWMADSLASSPAFDREQIAAVLDDMESHYRAAGLGQSGVLMARFETAWMAGRLEEAERLRAQLETTPRDSHSHCEACVRSVVAGFLIDTDREGEAIRLVEELVEGELSCGEEPEHALARSLVPYLHTGEFEKARLAHLRSYRLAKDNADNLAIVADNIVFCAITGNEARALSLVERHLDWLAHDSLGVDGHLSALAAFAVALEAVSAAGHAGTVVRGADSDRLRGFFGVHDGPWHAAELAAVMRAEAERIASAFDRRDGTDGHRRRLDRAWAVGRERYALPLSAEPLLPRAAPIAVRSSAETVQRAIDLGDYGAVEALAAAEAAIPEASGAQRPQLESIRRSALLARDDIDGALAAHEARIAALHADGRDDEADVERRAGLALAGRTTPEDVDTLRALSADAESLPPRSRVAVAVVLAVATAEADAEGARALLDDAADRAAALADDGLRHTVALARASFLGAVGELDACTATIAAALDDRDLGAGMRARLLGLRARTRGGQERFAEGAADADELCRILVELDARSVLAGAYVLAAALTEDAGAPAEAVARYRFAESAASEAGDPATGVRYRLARALLASGSADEAAELLVTVYTDETDRDEPAASRAQTLMLLARAFEDAGEPGRAVGAWEFAAELFDEGGAPAGRANALLSHGRLLHRFGELDDALGSLETAVAIARSDPDQAALLAEARHSEGQVRAARGEEDAIAALDEAREIADALGAPWLVADITDSRARALVMLGRPDESVATALQAADAFAEIGDGGSAGAAELFAARVLTQNARPADAVPLYRSVIERAAAIPPLLQVAAGELGDVYDALGRPAEAAEVRALLEA
ncbi:hypothetical protein [Microbacterium sp. cf332]|uniref:hypothetical protein n=1 Tax=Microbacterium sp. cf332 TaxID=1761804 RepID=UPI00088F72E8|nr:hypothetical protein [Microbacterium sp. cf332]SDQ24701.1 hypothetical protein SAMN04487847_1056 [Microbacterium sp. cf332]